MRVQSGDELGEMAAAFNRMTDQVLEHTQELERLNDELRMKEALRGQLLGKVITAQEEERKRIARELHDQLAQALSGMTMGMQITVVFKGASKWTESETKMVLAAPQMTYAGVPINAARISLSVDEPLLAPEGSLITPNPPLVPATLFLLVVGGVWSLYAYVVAQILGIRKDGVPVARENKLRFEAKSPRNR